MAFLGQESIWAAEAAKCAQDQNQFWAYHDKLFNEQQGENSGAFTKANLKRFAADLHLDTQQFDSCLDADKYLQDVQNERQTGQQMGVNSTPTFFINGQKYEGVLSYDRLSAIVKAATPMPNDSGATPTR